MLEYLSKDFLNDGEIWLSLIKIADNKDKPGWLPAYHFNIMQGNKVVGLCDLRIGHNRNTFYGGNIGYEVYEDYRGNHYAQKACRILFKLARMNDMHCVFITCNPENIASDKTLQSLNGDFIGTVILPEDNDMRLEFQAYCKHIYIFKTEED